MKSKLYIATFFCCVFGVAQYSITTDTSRFIVSKYKDSLIIKQHLDYVFDNFRRKKEEESIATTTYLLNKAINIKNNSLEASALNITGSIYSLTGQFDKAISNYQKAIELFQLNNNSYSLATMYNNIGSIYNRTQQFKLAIEYFNNGLVISNKYNYEKTTALININLSNLYIQNNALDKSLKYALVADSLTKKLKMTVEEAVNANLIGAIYFYKNNFNEAIRYYELSRKLAISTGDKHSENSAKLNIGEAQIQLNIHGAEENLLESLSYFQTISDYYNIQLASNLLKEFYIKSKKYDKALDYGNKAFIAEKKIIDSVNYKTFSTLQTKYETQQKENKILLLNKSDSLKTLQLVEQQLAISKNLYQLTQQKFALINSNLQIAEDSILLFSQNQTILQNQLDSSKKEEKITLLTKEGLQKELAIQKQKAAITQKNNTIAIVAVSSALFLLFGYGIFRKKQLEQKAFLAAEQAKQREQLTKAIVEAEEAERKRIASDLHDGVGQLFSAVKMNLNGLLDRVEFAKTDDKFLAEKTMALVDESCKEVRVISHKMMPNFLLKSGIASDIRSFIEKIDENSLKINFETKGFKDQLEFNEEVILYRVIQELINNVIKHAQANELNLVLEKNSKQILVQVADNGKGFNYQLAKAKGA